MFEGEINLDTGGNRKELTPEEQVKDEGKNSDQLLANSQPPLSQPDTGKKKKKRRDVVYVPDLSQPFMDSQQTIGNDRTLDEIKDVVASDTTLELAKEILPPAGAKSRKRKKNRRQSGNVEDLSRFASSSQQTVLYELVGEETPGTECDTTLDMSKEDAVIPPTQTESQGSSTRSIRASRSAPKKRKAEDVETEKPLPEKVGILFQDLTDSTAFQYHFQQNGIVH